MGIISEIEGIGVKIESEIKGFETDVLKFLSSDKAKAAAITAASFVEDALPFVTEFAGTNYAVAAVVALLNKYALPVATALTSGTALPDEVKLLVGQAVSALLSKEKGISTTVANIARDLAYLEAKAQGLLSRV